MHGRRKHLSGRTRIDRGRAGITPLVALNAGDGGIIVSTAGGRGIRARFRGLGLVEGQRIRKLSSIGLGGPVIILVNRAQVAIGRGMANHILVRKIDENPNPNR